MKQQYIFNSSHSLCILFAHSPDPYLFNDPAIHSHSNSAGRPLNFCIQLCVYQFKHTVSHSVGRRLFGSVQLTSYCAQSGEYLELIMIVL